MANAMLTMVFTRVKSRRTWLAVAAGLSLALILAWSLGTVETQEPQLSGVATPASAHVETPEPSVKAASASIVETGRSTLENHLHASPDSNSAHLRSLASQLLLDYQSNELDSDDKRSVQAFLREISGSDEGRALISRLFFSAEDPKIAASMYDLILDADLKDPALIATLIQQDKTEFRVDQKIRLVDLIADLNTSRQPPYSVEVEEFLAEMAVHPDAQLRSAALAQWAWYASHHGGILSVLDTYLFNHAREAREEIYEMIELDTLNDAAEKREVALALDALIYADYLKVDAEELKRVRMLTARLSSE